MRRVLSKSRRVGARIPSLWLRQPRQILQLWHSSLSFRPQYSSTEAQNALYVTDKTNSQQGEDLSYLEDPHYGDRPYKDLPPLEGPDAAELAEVRWSTFLILLTFGTLSFVGWYWFKRFSWTRDPEDVGPSHRPIRAIEEPTLPQNVYRHNKEKSEEERL
eukprot:gb/GECG01003498.1/.p1 GENE.gb/GECG01003498.1/~~gb/GECG01003498.1/.p1  ORF type:complete len:160 (+),score=17.02 gb/GECG01003498.1/:1-480(+)